LGAVFGVLLARSFWYGLFTPKGTPEEAQTRMLEELKKASLTDDFKTAWANNGAEFSTMSPAQFGGFVSAEIKRWATVVKASGAKLD
jgi:tripartite-type tricarboxylate transporter receptor subunit TctC